MILTAKERQFVNAIHSVEATKGELPSWSVPEILKVAQSSLSADSLISELKRHEADPSTRLVTTAARLVSLPVDGWDSRSFGDKLVAMHAYLLGDWDETAGTLRASDEDVDDLQFDENHTAPKSDLLPEVLKRVEVRIESAKRSTMTARISLLGQIHGLLEGQKPFVRGNGWTIRALIEQLAYSLGVSIMWPETSSSLTALEELTRSDENTSPEQSWGELYHMFCERSGGLATEKTIRDTFAKEFNGRQNVEENNPLI